MTKRKLAYGYLTPRAYLIGKGWELGLAKENHPSSIDINLIVVTADRLLEDAGLGDPRQARRCLVFTSKERTEMSHAHVLATNDREDELPLQPPDLEVIERLKNVLGVSYGPRWWIYAS